MKILAADIGGTNARFAEFHLLGDGKLEKRSSHWLSTSDAESFPALVDALAAEGMALDDLDAAVLAVAGPVEGGTYSNPPLIKWDIDISAPDSLGRIRRKLLINDFVAQAYACLSPLKDGFKEILPGHADAGGTMAVVGAGTGFGKAALVSDVGGGYVVMPSEGGHESFPFESQEEDRYRDFLLKKLGVAYLTPNVVVASSGITHLFEYITGQVLDTKEAEQALGGNDEVLAWAARFYGRVARNFALDTLATGGVFIAGGVAARNPGLVGHGAFEAEFRRSDSHAQLMSRIPVYLNDEQESGLWGAAMRASTL